MATKNDRAWRKYLDECHISLKGGSRRIAASELKRVTGREPRLMARFDTPEQLPKPLRDAGYTVLAVTNGEYLLAPGNVFAPVPEEEECEDPIYFKPAWDFPLVTLGRGSGESQYLDMAHASGMFADFLNIRPLYLTIRGRERTTSFSFQLQGHGSVDVDAVQIEVDAGYEGRNDIVLVEAKVGSPKHLNIRQLYYPYRHFSTRFPRKKISTLFLSYDIHHDTYTLHKFVFDPPECLNALQHVSCRRYRLSIKVSREVAALMDVDFETTSDIVPQADDFNKILGLLEAVDEGWDTSGALADYFNFERRQGNYYAEAAEYLGLLRREHKEYELSDSGANFLSLGVDRRREYIAKAVVNSWLFRELIDRAHGKEFFDRADIEALICSVQRAGGSRYTGTTVGRRRQTIEAWARWLAEEFGCFEEDNTMGRFYLH